MSDIIFLKSVDSTNSYLKSHIGEISDGTIVTAEEQTAGRGRLGHSWNGAAGMLPLSVAFVDPPEYETLTARMGLAVCDSIERTVPKIRKCGIKWTNDVIIANRKVCGILCESVRFCDKNFVICGIGVNISQNEEYFKEAGLPNAGSILSVSGENVGREVLLREIAEQAKSRAAMPFSECIEEYRSRLLNIGKQVRLISPNGERSAFAVDIAQNGALICRDENGVFQVNSGEVSVRGENGYI